jgi:hypothetical protein
MPGVSQNELLAGFTAPLPYAMKPPPTLPPRLAYTQFLTAMWSSTSDGRAIGGRRLRQHLTGNRGSSVLHDEVAHALDSPGRPASAAEIAEWLARCTISWHETDEPAALKESLVVALKPRFNRQIPEPRCSRAYSSPFGRTKATPYPRPRLGRPPRDSHQCPQAWCPAVEEGTSVTVAHCRAPVTDSLDGPIGHR